MLDSCIGNKNSLSNLETAKVVAVDCLEGDFLVVLLSVGISRPYHPIVPLNNNRGFIRSEGRAKLVVKGHSNLDRHHLLQGTR